MGTNVGAFFFVSGRFLLEDSRFGKKLYFYQLNFSLLLMKHLREELLRKKWRTFSIFGTSRGTSVHWGTPGSSPRSEKFIFLLHIIIC